MAEFTQYTRCPQCQTAFKVTEKLLAAAKGKVRCGACLAVFQADKYFVKPKAVPVPAASEDTQATPQTQNNPRSPLEIDSVDSHSPVHQATDQANISRPKESLNHDSAASNVDSNTSNLESNIGNKKVSSEEDNNHQRNNNEQPTNTLAVEAEKTVEPEQPTENVDSASESHPQSQYPDDGIVRRQSQLNISRIEDDDIDEFDVNELEAGELAGESEVEVENNRREEPVIEDAGFDFDNLEDFGSLESEGGDTFDVDQIEPVESLSTSDPLDSIDVPEDLLTDEALLTDKAEVVSENKNNEQTTDQKSEPTLNSESSSSITEPNIDAAEIEGLVQHEEPTFNIDDAEADNLEEEAFIAESSNDEDFTPGLIPEGVDDTFAEMELETERDNSKKKKGTSDLDLIDEPADSIEPSTTKKQDEEDIDIDDMLDAFVDEQDELLDTDGDSLEKANFSEESINEELLDEESDLLSDNLLNQIQDTDTEPDPLDEYEERVEDKKTGLRNGVIAAVILILFGLGANQFWQNRQTLSWDETWGGVTKSICGFLPCDLQPRRAIDKLKLRQRMVTPSDADEKQLSIKILLINEADFAQPYPRITINFSNRMGEKVATQQFTVSDYFPEKSGQLIPAGAEVHLSFETELPHPDALGFEFLFD